MNKMKFMVLFMSITMIFSGCASMNNTGKGAAIGGGSGAALGAILGGVIGKGKGCLLYTSALLTPTIEKIIFLSSAAIY